MDNNIEKAIAPTLFNPDKLFFVYVAFFSIAFYCFWNETTRRVSKCRNETKEEVVEEKHLRFHDLPSPRGYPIVGHMMQLGSHPHVILTEWSKKYNAPLLRIKMGFQDVLVVSGIDTIRDAALKQGTVFAGRPDLETSKLVCSGLSLTFSDYSLSWHHQKMSAKAAVSLYTTGKDPTKRSVMERSAAKHANNLVDQLLSAAEQKGGTVDPRDYVLSNLSSAICTVCFGVEFDPDDPKLRDILSINRTFDAAMGACQPVNFWPVLKYFPLMTRSFKNLETYMERFWKFITSLLASHWSTYNDNELRDVVDCLYHESEKLKRNNNETTAKFDADNQKDLTRHALPKQSDVTANGIKIMNGCEKKSQKNGKYNCRQNGHVESILKRQSAEDAKAELELRNRIIFTTGDIFGAGYDTMFTTIHWAVLYLSAYPDTQNEIREEINRVVPSQENPSFRLHRSQCPYTQAWIYEMLRHASFSPLLIPHCTTATTVLENCVVPAGIMVYFNAWQVHKDPLLWDKPEEFNPSRFLTEKDGKRCLKQNSFSKLLAWGIGTRKCLGQHLSKQLIFIFLCTMVRRCVITQSKPGIEPVLPWPTTFGLTLKPNAFTVSIKRC